MMNVDVGQFMETLMMPEANLHRRVHNIFRVSPLNITIVGFQWRCDVRAEFQLSNYLITISTAISLQLSIFRGSNVIGQMPCPSLRCCQSFTAAPVTCWFQRDWIAESAAHERRRRLETAVGITAVWLGACHSPRCSSKHPSSSSTTFIW